MILPGLRPCGINRRDRLCWYRQAGSVGCDAPRQGCVLRSCESRQVCSGCPTCPTRPTIQPAPGCVAPRQGCVFRSPGVGGATPRRPRVYDGPPSISRPRQGSVVMAIFRRDRHPVGVVYIKASLGGPGVFGTSCLDRGLCRRDPFGVLYWIVSREITPGVWHPFRMPVCWWAGALCRSSAPADKTAPHLPLANRQILISVLEKTNTDIRDH